MFNGPASFQPHTVQPHVLRRGIMQPEQGYVRYSAHIDQPFPGPMTNFLERDAQRPALPASEVELAVEAVDEFAAMSYVVYTQPELQRTGFRVLHVDEQHLEPAP